MGGSFYFSSNGDLLLQYNSITNFPYKYLELADQVINRSDKINKLYSLEKEYKSTKTKTPEFIRKYINLSKEFDRNSDTAVEEYVSKLPIDSIYNKSIIRLVMEQGLPLNSRISQLIKNSNITLYDTIWKSLDNNKRVEINRKIISSTQSIAFRTKNENLAFQLSTFIRGTYGTDYKKGQFYSLKMLLSFYKLTNNSNKYFRISDNLIYDMMKVSNDTLKNWDKKEQQFSITSNSEIRRYSKVSCQYASELNSIAWNYYDMSTDLEDLAKALKWVKRALEINAEVCKPQNNDNSALLDTYAHLLYKMNQFDEAISWQKKAIEVRKNAGINSVSLENELEKMQKRSIKFL
jgi:tetratricopeptide (TPR) repeat protein